MQHIAFLTRINTSMIISLLMVMQRSYTENSTQGVERQRNVNKAFWEIDMCFSGALWVAECIHALLTNTNKKIQQKKTKAKPLRLKLPSSRNNLLCC